MRIAVVGATGRIGAELTRTLLSAGHQVKALSRGGPALDALVKIGAEPFLGSFDTGKGELDTFFEDADAAFLMVKTDWKNIHGHYPAVAQRFVDALRNSPVKLAVSLTAMGSDVKGSTGHFESFYHLDQKLNQLDTIDLVHLRAGWFNYLFVGPELHRYHHSADLREAQNYAVVLSLIDVLFGTFVYKPGRLPERIGVADPADYPRSVEVWKIMLLPFLPGIGRRRTP